MLESRKLKDKQKNNYYTTTILRPLAGTTQVRQYHILDFAEAEIMGWPWHQLDHIQAICTWLQTNNHANMSSAQVFYGPDALPATQPIASSTEGLND